MTNFTKIIHGASFAIGAAAVAIALSATSKVEELTAEVSDLKSKSVKQESLSADSSTLNQHIDVRIDQYVARVKQRKVDQKFTAYEGAAEHTQSGKRIYGNEQARFTLVGYSDIECPYCRKFHSTPKGIVDASNGLVSWEFVHLPLPFHNPAAFTGAVAAECAGELAGNRGFWVYLQSLFDNTKGNGKGAGDLVALAGEIGIDEQAFAHCMESGKHREKVAADLQKAKDLGVNSTPATFIVDNRTGQSTLVRGMQKPEAFASMIAKLKKEADAELLSQSAR